jgi:hypothetical protein
VCDAFWAPVHAKAETNYSGELCDIPATLGADIIAAPRPALE